VDYVGYEKDGQSTILLTSLGPITKDFTVPLMILSFEEFFTQMGRNLSDQFDSVVIPDPAECKWFHCLV